MAKIILLSLPLSVGHINPTLGVVKELLSNGDQVVYYTTENFREKVEAAGAEYRRYAESVHEFCRVAQTIGVNNFYLLVRALETCREMIPELVRELGKEQVDLIMHEILVPWGKLVAQELGVPALSYGTTFVMTKETLPRQIKHKLLLDAVKGFRYVLQARRVAGELEKTYQTKCTSVFEVIDNTEERNLIFTSRYFQPAEERFDQRYRFTGPSIVERGDSGGFPFGLLHGKRVIYISLGTVFNEDVEFFRMCLEAFRDGEELVVMSVGRKLAEGGYFSKLPENVLIREYVPQLEVLKRADLFITHGGMNSVNEALYYRVPMIVIPIDADQPLVANRLSELGAGVMLLRGQISAAKLRDTARKILGAEAYRANAAKLGETLRAAGGARKAAEEIRAYLEENGVQGSL